MSHLWQFTSKQEPFNMLYLLTESKYSLMLSTVTNPALIIFSDNEGDNEGSTRCRFLTRGRDFIGGERTQKS